MSESSLPPPPPPATPPRPAPGAPEPPENAGALPPGNWGPSRVLAGLALLLVVTLLLVGVISIFDSELETIGGRISVQVALAASMVGVAFLVARPGSIANPASLGLRRPVVPSIRPAALAYLAYIGCAIVIAIVIQPEQDDVTDQLGYGESPVADVIVAALVIGVAPLTEEIFFRGFMFGGLRRRMPFIAAAGISAGIWGLFHYTGSGTWGVVVQLVAFGVILSWLYERTGSIWPPVAVHVLNNAIAFAILTS